MHAIAKVASQVGKPLGCLMLVACLLLVPTDTAWAAKKKKEPEAGPTKSYTVPYMIVLALVGIGLMTVLRPHTRKEKPDEKKKDDEEA